MSHTVDGLGCLPIHLLDLGQPFIPAYQPYSGVGDIGIYEASCGSAAPRPDSELSQRSCKLSIHRM